MLDVTTKTKAQDDIDVRIRSATADDLTTLKAVVRAVGQEHDTATTGDWLRQLNRGGLIAYIAIVDNKIVGAIITTHIANPNSRQHTTEILCLFVAQHYRRCRIATRLLRHALPATGAVRLIVPPGNDAAAKFFRSVGFATPGDVLMTRSN